MVTRRIAVGTVTATLALALVNSAALAQDPGVAPIDSTPYGLTYGEWSALHWQWLYSMPIDGHALFDTADCSENQMDQVWFLGGTFAAIEIEPGVILGEADRDCTMPSGTALFFPLIDVECSTIEGNGETEEELRECANFFADFIDPSTVFLEVDGQPMDVEFYRAESPLFEYRPLPDNNVLQLFGLDAPEGSTTPAVSDGYWAMLAPLSVGTHTVSFGGVADYTSIGGPVFIQDIMYTVTVVPRGQY